MANVSIGTVDRALHGRDGIKESTRQRILQVARQISYRPNLAARALSVAKASARIGVCVPREIHFFYDQLWGGILDEARRVEQLGIQFLHRPVHALGEGDISAFKELLQASVDGIIVAASATGSQLGPYAYGAGRVIWVVGAQKVVPDLETALRRMREYCYPREDERARRTYGQPSAIAKTPAKPWNPG